MKFHQRLSETPRFNKYQVFGCLLIDREETNKYRLTFEIDDLSQLRKVGTGVCNQKEEKKFNLFF